MAGGRFVCTRRLMQETGLLAKGAHMHVVFARNAAFRINNSIHAAAALLPALQLLSGRCGKLPSKLGSRIGGHMTSNHSSAYASTIVLDLECTPALRGQPRSSRPLRRPDDRRALPHDARRRPCDPTRGHEFSGQEPVRREAPLVHARRFLWRAGRASRQPESPGACLRMTEDASPASPRGRRIRYDVMRR